MQQPFMFCAVELSLELLWAMGNNSLQQIKYQVLEPKVNPNLNPYNQIVKILRLMGHKEVLIYIFLTVRMTNIQVLGEDMTAF